MNSEVSFLDRLKEAYEKGKKPFAYILILAIFSIEVLSNLSIVDDAVAQKLELTLTVTVVIMMLEILFQIYEKIVADKGRLKIIKPNALYDEILFLVKNSKKVEIQYIGVAGRFGWYSVLSRLLDKSNDDSLHDTNQFNVEVALVSTDFYQQNQAILEKFDALMPITQDIARVGEQLAMQYTKEARKQLDFYQYDYLPNFVGFLINGNYLFLNTCYWEELEDKSLSFRAGGTDYLVYDKNDEFGGAHYIERFTGWFNYIKRQSQQQE